MSKIDTWLTEKLRWVSKYPYPQRNQFGSGDNVLQLITEYQSDHTDLVYKNNCIATFYWKNKEGRVFLSQKDLSHLRRINTVLKCLDLQERQFSIKNGRFCYNKQPYKNQVYAFVIKHTLEDFVF